MPKGVRSSYEDWFRSNVLRNMHNNREHVVKISFARIPRYLFIDQIIVEIRKAGFTVVVSQRVMWIFCHNLPVIVHC